MTAEKIIERIKKDTEIEIKQIQKDTQQQITKIINEAKTAAKQQAEKIIHQGKLESENQRKILVSQANQDIKRDIMNARETIIEQCFTKAHHELSTLKESMYRETVKKLLENGYQKLKGDCTVLVSRDLDREIAQQMGVQVIGSVETAGGMVIKSSDGRVTLDHTFDGILKRKKDEIRRQVGKLLFPT